MGKSAPPSNNSYKGIAELYYVETDVATFRLHSSCRGQTNTRCEKCTRRGSTSVSVRRAGGDQNHHGGLC